ncbi:MAG TPA: hypothetical protein VHH36_06495 [Candidatus Thermoplasmatota archaeon]|nr:hypothetical protein [Candidatus Thermoplasmatota archaeon]
MRPLAVAVTVALLAPGAFAAHAPDARLLELPLFPGRDAAFEVEVPVSADGVLYAKLLATAGNAVNDGTRANGSLEDRTGWRVSFALVREGGAREELGDRVNSDPSATTPVRAGESPTLVATVRVPADAAKGGERQAVYVAIAWRASPGGADPGASSGGSMDESRAVTLVLSAALAGGLQPPPVEETPAEEIDDAPVVPPVSEIPTGAQGGDAQALVRDAELPAWLVATVLVVLAVAVLALGAAVLALALVVRELRRQRPTEPPAGRRVTVLEPVDETVKARR